MAYKKLDRGRFRWPDMQADPVTMTLAKIAALLQGIDLSKARRLIARPDAVDLGSRL